MYSTAHNLLHIHIPKCGGTALEAALREAGVDWRDPEGGTHRAMTHEPVYVWRKRLGAERFLRSYRFAVIRHPGAVLVSLYHYHRDRNPPPQVHWVPPHVSFDQWMMEHVATAPGWVAQDLGDLLWWLVDVTDFDRPPWPLLVDDVFRLDDLATAPGWARFLDRLAERCPTLPWLTSGTPPPVFRRENATDHAPWESYFHERPDLRAIVERRYARDFECFGWSWPTLPETLAGK